MEQQDWAQICEAVMLLCFGFSWPMAILKTIRAKNPAGKSLLFAWLIIAGYIAGMVRNALCGINAVFALYLINTMMVATDTALTYYYLAVNRRCEADERQRQLSDRLKK